MKVIRNKLIPFAGYQAINICGVVFTRRKQLTDTCLQHEAIHTEQWKETWYVGFLPIYIFDYLRQLVKLRNHKQAYRAIPMEREAYEHQRDPEYLRHRKRFAWRGL